jgi:hypothetical protein
MKTAVSEKVKQWIDQGKDPRAAHWQGGLEAVLDLFMPVLEPGRLIPVKPLNEKELSLFLSVLEIVDLSPNLPAAFLPPSVADSLRPPASAEELHHIEKGKSSFKILIGRPGKEDRILCAEISEHAHKPGVDIFQSGALLGTYDFENQQDCFAELNKIIRAHIWQKEKWNSDDFIRYTVNWFEKILDLRKKEICVENDYSFFHSPTLIKSNKIDAIFILIAKVIETHLNDPENPVKARVRKILAAGDEQTVNARLHDFLDKVVFELLTVMKECELVDFDKLTDSEMEQFNRESARIIRNLMTHIKTM